MPVRVIAISPLAGSGALSKAAGSRYRSAILQLTPLPIGPGGG